METMGNKPMDAVNYSEWAERGMMPVINHPSRVYHVWVNGNEHFCYRGNARALNEMLKAFATVKTDVHEVTLVPGPPTRTKLGEKDRLDYDWEVHLLTGLVARVQKEEPSVCVGEHIPSLFVYVGSDRLKLSDVTIPQGVTAIGPEALRERYLKAMKAEDGRMRGMAAYRLAQLEPFNKDNVPLFTGMLKQDRDVAWFAAGALEKMGALALPALPVLEAEMEKQSKHRKQRFQDVIESIEKAKDRKKEAEAYRKVREEIQEFLGGASPTLLQRKSETRNTKSETNSKSTIGNDRNSATQTFKGNAKALRVLNIRAFVLRICFEFRISNFGFDVLGAARRTLRTSCSSCLSAVASAMAGRRGLTRSA